MDDALKPIRDDLHSEIRGRKIVTAALFISVGAIAGAAIWAAAWLLISLTGQISN